jgi:predicted nucleic acid-binding protein
MTARRRRDLADRIDPGASLLIDTSVVLAYLAGGEPTSQAATELFDSMLATGRNRASLSMVTVAEILVRPFRRSQIAVATAEGFLQHFADIRLVPVTNDIAREAARLRAVAELRMPDALIVASALVAGVDAIVTNDRSWRSRLSEQVPEATIIELDEISRS